MNTEIKNNPYNRFKADEFGQDYDILHIALWQGETLPKNYTWYGLGQEALRSEYPELYKAVEKYGWLVSEEDWQAGQCGKFSDGDNETTFRFPLIRDGDVLAFTNGTTISNGVKIEPELPNIKGTVKGAKEFRLMGASGAFTLTSSGISGKGDETGRDSHAFAFDASRSNPIYKDGGTVKQSGIAARLIIKYK